MKKVTENWLRSVLKGEPESEENALVAYRDVTEELTARAHNVRDLLIGFQDSCRVYKYFDADMVKEGRQEDFDKENGVSESEVRDFIHELLNHVWFNFSDEFRADMKEHGIVDDDMIF